MKNDFRNYYDIITIIGEGSFGKVYKVKMKEKNEYRALKLIDKNIIKLGIKNEYCKQNVEKEFKDYFEDFYWEIEFMKFCGNNNKFSVKYYENFENDNEFAIVMELCDENLLKFCRRKKQGFNFKEIYTLLSQLNNTFKIISENKIAHRDLKLENILIKYENKEKDIYTFKLTDYGISKRLLSLSKRFSSQVGTLNIMAPEILKGEKYDNECDLWSLGVIIYILFFKSYPYTAVTEAGILTQITKFGTKLLKKSKNFNFDNLIEGLLEINPKKRLTWEKYFNHPFFENKPFGYNISKENKMEKESKTINNKSKKRNEIKIKINVDPKRINEKIFFINNQGMNGEKIDRELNENNTELYINERQYKYTNYFIPEKEGIYNIRLKLNIEMKDCSFLFANCQEITSIDLSSFKTNNVISMEGMFGYCYNLTNIDLTSFDTKNVITFEGMFAWCNNLENIDLSSFDINNAIIPGMFFGCLKLKEITIKKVYEEKIKKIIFPTITFKIKTI